MQCYAMCDQQVSEQWVTLVFQTVVNVMCDERSIFTVNADLVQKGYISFISPLPVY